MGPELIAAIFGPIIAGSISVAVWQSRSNSQGISKSLDELHDCVHQMGEKVSLIQVDLAKNYCTKDELKEHVDKEEEWHDKFSQDLNEMKDMQWRIRLDQISIKQTMEDNNDSN